jgi:hypothetical protein
MNISSYVIIIDKSKIAGFLVIAYIIRVLLKK